MALNEKDVLQVLDLFADSEWDDLTVVSGDVRLVVSKRSGTAVSHAPAAAPAPAQAQGQREVAAPSGQARPSARQPAEGAGTVAVAPADEDPPVGTVAVRSPTLGTFFVAPKPGAPPFVAVGDTVAAGDTVAIVEVMKLMNPVKVEVAGEITKVCARNNELVEYDRVLFWVKPG